jgi:osmotically-inducible protein OsmY
MYRNLCLIILPAALLLTASCGRREQGAGDGALVQAVREAFGRSPDLRGATARVQVSARDGVVTLSVTADTEKDKELAGTFARQTPGVKGVENQIAVTGPIAANVPHGTGSPDEEAIRREANAGGERVGEGGEDARIYQEVRRRIVVERATPERAIFIDVVNGDVTLRGMISTVKARDEAVAAAKDVEGVKTVRDLLLINSPAP